MCLNTSAVGTGPISSLLGFSHSGMQVLGCISAKSAASFHISLFSTTVCMQQGGSSAVQTPALFGVAV